MPIYTINVIVLQTLQQLLPWLSVDLTPVYTNTLKVKIENKGLLMYGYRISYRIIYSILSSTAEFGLKSAASCRRGGVELQLELNLGSFPF